MRLTSILFSVFVHVTALGLAVFWSPSSTVHVRLDIPTYQVDLVTLEASKPAPAPKPKPEPKAAPKPEPKPEPKPVPKPVVTPKPAPKPVPKAISPKKVEKKKRPAPKPSEDPKAVLAKALKEAKADAKRKEKNERNALADELKSLRSQVKKDDEQRASSGSGQAMASGAEAVYAGLVENLVKQNWRYPAVTSNAFLTCVVGVDLAPDGTIIGSRILRSSGREDFDSSTLRAVQETRTLPEPPSKDIKTIQINFNLQELFD